MKSKVAIVRCGSYNTEEVRKAVSRGLELMGGAESFVKQDEKILLKVNLLAGEVPEKCVNTHPAVFRAVAELFATKGAIVLYGDSPVNRSVFANITEVWRSLQTTSELTSGLCLENII